MQIDGCHLPLTEYFHRLSSRDFTAITLDIVHEILDENKYLCAIPYRFSHQENARTNEIAYKRLPHHIPRHVLFFLVASLK